MAKSILSGLVLVLTGLIGPAGAADQPNVVLILADDLGWGDVGFNGRTQWKTPHLDNLSRQGVKLSRCYTSAVVCAPSRAALMTGKYSIHNGVSGNNQDLPSGETTIAEALKAKGYATGLFGKWHHGKPRDGQTTYVHPMDQGFDEFFGFTDAVEAWQHFPKTLWDGRVQKPVTGYSTDLFTDHAIDFVTRNQAKPFFVYVPYTASHFNIEAPDDEVALHQGKFAETKADAPLNATYAAMVTRLDRNIGRLLKTLDDLKLAENTVVIFTSDHGATFEVGNGGTSSFHDSNRPFRGQKRTLWEGGIRVPGVVRWPGHVPEGKVINDPVHLTDLFPTILAIAGGQPDPTWKVDGVSQLDLLTTTKPAPERTLFWEWRSEGNNQLAAMRGHYKVVVTGANRPELFDVEADPAERRNVIAQHPELAKKLGDELKAWMATEIVESGSASLR